MKRVVLEWLAETELKNDCACVTYGQSAGRRRENLDSSNKFLMLNQSQKGDVILSIFYLTFSFPKRFIYLRGIAFSDPYC